jgi:hypothetical protein
MLEKDYLIEVRERFFHLHRTLENFWDAKTALKTRIDELREQGKTLRTEILEKKIHDEKMKFQNRRPEFYSEFEGYVDELIETINEIDTRPIEPERVREIRDAIELIKSGAMDMARTDQLNRSFDGDQQALKTLREFYVNGNYPDGNIKNMINDHVDLPGKLKDLGRGVILGDDSINQTGRFIGDLAKCYAVHKYEWSFNPDGFMEALRSGARLSDKD